MGKGGIYLSAISSDVMVSFSAGNGPAHSPSEERDANSESPNPSHFPHSTFDSRQLILCISDELLDMHADEALIMRLQIDRDNPGMGRDAQHL